MFRCLGQNKIELFRSTATIHLFHIFEVSRQNARDLTLSGTDMTNLASKQPLERNEVLEKGGR